MKKEKVCGRCGRNLDVSVPYVALYVSCDWCGFAADLGEDWNGC